MPARENHHHERGTNRSGASAPAPLPMTVHPMVRTRKKVPISSAMYLFMPDLLQTLHERDLWKALDLQGARIVLPTVRRSCVRLLKPDQFQDSTWTVCVNQGMSWG